MSESVPNLQQIKDSMRAAWMEGDFGVVAKTIAPGGVAFVDRLPIAAGDRVLDVACGTGNLAIPAACRGAVVTGVDIASNLLDQARERAAKEGLEITFDVGDAEDLPYPDASFDAVITMFGAMFAPRPERVASELARVLKPGGLLAMANWNPESFTADIFRTSARHVPTPPGVPPPVYWGDPLHVRDWLAGKFVHIETTLVPIDFDLPMNPGGCVDFFRTYFGPTMVAFSRLDARAQKKFAEDLTWLWTSRNAARDPEHHTLIHNEYLRVTARRA